MTRFKTAFTPYPAPKRSARRRIAPRVSLRDDVVYKEMTDDNNSVSRLLLVHRYSLGWLNVNCKNIFLFKLWLLFLPSYANFTACTIRRRRHLERDLVRTQLQGWPVHTAAPPRLS